MKRLPMRRQHGQAMLETMIAASMVLVPLFLALPTLAKYLDIRSHAVQAARYAAWERTIYFGGPSASEIGWGSFTNAWVANEKNDNQIKAEVATRILSSNSATSNFSSSDKNAGDFRAGKRKLLWQDRKGQSLIAYGQVQGTAGQTCDPAGDFSSAMLGYDCAPGTINRVLMPVATLASILGPFTLEMGGKYTATVTLSPSNFSRQSYLVDTALASQPMREKLVVLGNGWSADGPNADDKTSVLQQVKGLTPLSLLATEVSIPTIGTISIIEVVQTVFSIWAPELSPRKLEVGKIVPDEVPPDRLQ
ncbi:hypothetical protein FNU76_23285 [Chitinimonas arctica]|uniref:Uncharacterized protein n=1 Tax=Chitinimonas arctica TaxID=2594795 RepID=A0A516SLM2_9NEIS|nr:hypothetical protein [Chitinimonas arctica]QDQ29035.1 hypothetical protein FNU76_23285 [Chitinimonas arctica]